MKSKYRQFCQVAVLVLAVPFLLCGCLAGWLAAAFAAGCRQGWADWRKTDTPNAPQQGRRSRTLPADVGTLNQEEA